VLSDPPVLAAPAPGFLILPAPAPDFSILAAPAPAPTKKCEKKYLILKGPKVLKNLLLYWQILFGKLPVTI